MDRFHVIEDAAIIVRRKGIFRQVKVYRRADALYAGYFGGYVRLYTNGGSSIPDLSWEEIDLGGQPTFSDAHGKLLIAKPKLVAIA